MKRQLILIIHLMLCFSFVYAKDISTLYFKSDTECYVRVCQPIEGNYNFYYATDTLFLKPDSTQSIEINTIDFSSLRVEFIPSERAYILVSKGDSLMVEQKNREVIFGGNNAAGNQYLYDNYRVRGLGYYYEPITEIFKNNIDKEIDYIGIRNDFEKYITATYVKDINRLVQENQITPYYAELMNGLLLEAYTNIVFQIYKDICEKRFKDFVPNRNDSTSIIKEVTYYLENNISTRNSIKHYFQFSYYEYYKLLYNQMTEQQKGELKWKDSSIAFGIYSCFLLAKDNKLRHYLLADYFLYQLVYQRYDYERIGSLKFLTENCPQSTYLPIIRKLIDKEEQVKSLNNNTDIRLIDGENISTLDELFSLQELKGKILFVDLWSIYCGPCKAQFAYNQALENLLNQYCEISKLYISIDTKQFDKNWKQQIQYYKLSGYHVRTSEKLLEDISKLLYNGKSVGIPRYLLIDSKGKILNDNLPRPQILDKLKEELDSLLKKK